MPWLQLQLATNEQQQEAVSAWLEVLGAVSITLQDAADQPLLEPAPGCTPLWHDIQLIALFTDDTDVDSIMQQLQQQFPTQLGHYSIEKLADEVWERKWLENFQPMQFGQRLWICPSGYPIPDPTACNILLDPGLAFGTGTHPTTRLCLEWLDANIRGNESIVDFGCGSGILAIAALKLGAKQVWAIDHDEQALLATEDNGKRNAITTTQLITSNDHQLINNPCDVMLANILAKPLQTLAPTFAKLVKPQGCLVLSGILAEQLNDIEAAYQAFFTTVHVQQQEEWLRVDMQRCDHYF